MCYELLFNLERLLALCMCTLHTKPSHKISMHKYNLLLYYFTSSGLYVRSYVTSQEKKCQISGQMLGVLSPQGVASV